MIIQWNRRGVRVLMYHACDMKESDYIRGLRINTRPDRMAGQLDFLRKHYQVIAIEDLEGDHIPENSAAITFDDGYRSVYQNALPLLVERGLPATCYLVANTIGGSATIWINEINWYLHRYGIDVRERIAMRLGITPSRSRAQFILQVVYAYCPTLISALLEELRREFGPPTEVDRFYLNLVEIQEMAGSGFRFGNHTQTHAVLSRLDVSAAREEIAGARTAIAELPGALDSLAYPFGQFADHTASIARDLGYTTLMDVQGDNACFDPDHVGRVNVQSDSAAVLFARLELVAVFKAIIKRLRRRTSPSPAGQGVRGLRPPRP